MHDATNSPDTKGDLRPLEATLRGDYPAALAPSPVVLGRAAAPALLLFDEAFTNVDWELKDRLYHLYQEQVRGRSHRSLDS